MNLEKLLDEIKEMFGVSIKSREEFIEFIKNIDLTDANHYFDKNVNKEQLSSKDIISIKKDILKLDSKYNNYMENTPLDKDFGKPNQKNINRYNEFKEPIRDCTVLQALKFNGANVFLGSKKRCTYTFAASITDDLNEFVEALDILKETDNTKVHSKLNKTYGELKKDFFIKQLDRMESFLEYISKPMTDEEYLECITKNQSLFYFAGDVDGGKLDDILNDINLDKAQVADRINQFEKYKKIANSVNIKKNLAGLYVNPLIKYGELEDMMAFTVLLDREAEKEDGPVEFVDLLSKGQKAALNKCNVDGYRNQLSDFSFSGKFFEYEKARIAENGPEVFYTLINLNYDSILSLTAAKNKLEVEQLNIYSAKDNAKCNPIGKEGFDKAMAGEKLIIRDPSGKFLDTFSTEKNLFGLEKFDEKVQKFNVDIICRDFENSIKNGNFTLKTAKQNLDEMLGEEYDEKINNLYDTLNEIEDDIEVDGIKEILKEMIDEQSGYMDKETLCNGLKSVRTFAQGYLDMYIDSKDPEKVESCKAVESVYKSLISVDADLKRIKSCEDNLALTFSLKGKQLDPENLEKQTDELNKHNDKLKQASDHTKKKVPVFDSDPTINNINNTNVSKKVETEKNRKKDLVNNLENN